MLNFALLYKDETYMLRCLQLAAAAAGNVAPNPMVGAVLVYNGVIIGEGYHMKYGEPHAEVNCINSVSEENRHLIKESTLYVSLEPCNHFGKTPPCSDLIVKNKIPKVVIACKDSFEKVNGGGIKKLEDAGVKVTQDILKEDALELNKRFFTFHEKKRPYVILKWAQSNDKFIAHKNYQPVKITNDLTNRQVHKWRSEEAAILVGTNTALHDDPSLTTRLWQGKNPVRIFIDKNLQIPSGHHLLDNSTATIVINQIKDEKAGNTIFYKISEEEDVITTVLNLLYQKQLTSLIVEGGTTLLQSFIDAGLWDEAIIITNNDLQLHEGIDAPLLTHSALFCEEHILSDRLQFFKKS
ncbi:MAG: bifunctional diaminohydroxyphosphoribosylaminopyrimidine deaminase/5-amino-6-(5-phosphoribosylamino)uracil reductase RibD [Ferruginibacter sp.]